MQIHPPLRTDDFRNSYEEAPLAAVEELAAIDRLRLSAITPHEPGIFTFRLNNSPRFKQFWALQTDVRGLFGMDAVERDRFGTQFILGHNLAGIASGQHGAVCPWTAIPQAAQILRTQHIGPAFWDAYHTQSHFLSLYIADVIKTLALAEQPLNSAELPAVCRLKWGLLLRLGPGDAQRALDYLAIDEPADCSVPLKVNLGANCFAFPAWSASEKEPLRIGLSTAWNDDLALKDLSRWLRKLSILNEKKNLLQPT